MSKPMRQVLLLWPITAALIVGALVVFLGSPGTPDGGGEAVGRVIVHTGTAAFVTWFLARRKVPEWSWLKFILVDVAALAILGVITSFGSARAADPRPFSVDFPQGWSIETLNGVSSASQDQDKCYRESARWDGPEGAVAIDITCAARVDDKRLDVEVEFASLVRDTTRSYEALDIAVNAGISKVERHGSFEWRVVDLDMANSSQVHVSQRIAVTASPGCLLAGTITGTKEAYVLQRTRFGEVLDSVQAD
jgi:hypothetical protein